MILFEFTRSVVILLLFFFVLVICKVIEGMHNEDKERDYDKEIIWDGFGDESF